METMETCTFCEIIYGRQPGMILYEDREMLVIKDHKPVNKYHCLAIPKEHIPTEEDLLHIHKPIKLIKALIRNGKKVMSALGADMDDLLYGFHKHPYVTIRHLHLHLISPRRNFYFNGHLFQFNSVSFVSAGEVLRRLNQTRTQNHQVNDENEMHYREEQEEEVNCCVIL